MALNSLSDFYQSDIKKFISKIPNTKVLEVGCGEKSFFENIENDFNVTAIDISLDKILNTPQSKINYQAGNISNFESNQKFDFIFDTHAIHCITNLENRRKALRNIYDLLEIEGIFASEMMILPHDKSTFVNFPDRLVLDAYEIEKEFLSLDFKIKFFLIRSDLYFLESSQMNQRCDVLRIIVQK